MLRYLLTMLRGFLVDIRAFCTHIQIDTQTQIRTRILLVYVYGFAIFSWVGTSLENDFM